MPLLNIHSSHLMYGDDQTPTANPQRIFVDWNRHFNSLVVNKPDSTSFYVDPGASYTVFSGTRTTTIDGTTAFGITLNPALSSVYRITATGGTAPGFRTARSFEANGTQLTWTVNNNTSVKVTIGAGNFNASVGDQVFVPSTVTGDNASPFNAMNTGLWIVIATTATSLTLVRPIGTVFQGASESVTPSSTGTFLVFSSSGVQIGDNLEISSGFSPVSQNSYVVTNVTASWVEFTSTSPLPLETGILPGATGMTFYSASKRFVRIEVDQEAALRLNGDTGNSVRLSPIAVSDSSSIAFFEKWGPCWSLVVVNRSTTARMLVSIISAE